MEDRYKLITAAKLRGHSFKKGFVNMSVSINIFITLLLKSYEQSSRVFSAMKLRGFTGHFHTLLIFKTKAKDIIKTFLLLTSGIGLIVFEIFL